MATLIKADGTKQEMTLTGRKFTLERMQKLVGGYVQVIKLANNERLVVNEDGKPKGLPVNEEASRILQGHSDRHTVKLVGDVLWGDRKEFGLG